MHVCGIKCMYAETLGCMYADFGFMYAERLGAKYAVVGCMYMETLGCMYAVVGCMSMERLGACLTVGSYSLHAYPTSWAQGPPGAPGPKNQHN